MTKSINILNLVVIGIAILAIIMLRLKYKNEQYIETGPLGAQQTPPTLQWYGANPGYQGPQQMTQGPMVQSSGVPIMNYPLNQGLSYPSSGSDSNLGQQPYTFRDQFYPRVPYYPSVGRPCNGPNQCGPMANCYNGFCGPNQQMGTVFNIPM